MNSRTLTTVRDDGSAVLYARRVRRNLETFAIAALLLAGCSSAATPADPQATPGPAVATPTATTNAPAASTPPASVANPAPMMAAGGAPAMTMPPVSSQVPPAPGSTMPPMGGAATPPAADAPVELPVEMGTPTLFWLDIGSNRVSTAAADGSGSKMFASGAPLQYPDGVTVDPVDGHVFVLNMGNIAGGGNNASLVRYKLDGSSPEVIITPGSKAGDQTFNTGKQVTMDRVNRKLYMGDREGTKVWRSDLDGKNLEVLVSGHGIMQIVGVGADPTKKQFYFSDRNGKKLYRAGMEMPEGKTHADRDDLELLYADKAGNAMPLDIELDIPKRMMYWTDRQQNTVFGMSMDIPAGSDGMTRTDVKKVATGLADVIGLGLDHESGTLYATHSGSVSTFKTDGSGLKQIGMSGSTGIAFVKIP